MMMFLLFLVSCKVMMFEFTWEKAVNNYNLITGDKNNFGDQRLAYNKVLHRSSCLSNFLNNKCHDRGVPDFIYEYKSDTKCRGIKLFYVKLDSAFVFEEPKKNNLTSIEKEYRKMDDRERKIYEILKQKK